MRIYTNCKEIFNIYDNKSTFRLHLLVLLEYSTLQIIRHQIIRTFHAAKIVCSKLNCFYRLKFSLYPNFLTNIDFQNAPSCRNIKSLSRERSLLRGRKQKVPYLADFPITISLPGSCFVENVC